MYKQILYSHHEIHCYAFLYGIEGEEFRKQCAVHTYQYTQKCMSQNAEPSRIAATCWADVRSATDFSVLLQSRVCALSSNEVTDISLRDRNFASRRIYYVHVCVGENQNKECQR